MKHFYHTSQFPSHSACDLQLTQVAIKIIVARSVCSLCLASIYWLALMLTTVAGI